MLGELVKNCASLVIQCVEADADAVAERGGRLRIAITIVAHELVQQSFPAPFQPFRLRAQPLDAYALIGRDR